MILVNGEEDAEIYNMSGMRVRNENLAGGIYIVRKSWEPCSIGRILLRTIPVTLALFLIPILGLAIGFADALLARLAAHVLVHQRLCGID